MRFGPLDGMTDPLGREKEEGVAVANHGEAGEKSGSGSETEEHLAGLNDTNVSLCYLRRRFAEMVMVLSASRLQ